jgi:hypothetical protein
MAENCYLKAFVLVRKVFNKRSGKTYVQVVDQRTGDYCVEKMSGAVIFQSRYKRKIFDDIGFKKANDPIYKHLVISISLP